MREIVESGNAKILTVEEAKNLKGKKIQTIYFGYDHQDNTDEFVVGDITTSLALAEANTEEGFTSRGYKNQADYWKSYMTSQQLKRESERLNLLREDGSNTYIQYAPEYDSMNEREMWCSDIDRAVFYIMAE